MLQLPGFVVYNDVTRGHQEGKHHVATHLSKFLKVEKSKNFERWLFLIGEQFLVVTR